MARYGLFSAVKPQPTNQPTNQPSRSLEVIESDTDRSGAYDFLLMIHSNHGPFTYRVRHRRR